MNIGEDGSIFTPQGFKDSSNETQYFVIYYYGLVAIIKIVVLSIYFLLFCELLK